MRPNPIDHFHHIQTVLSIFNFKKWVPKRNVGKDKGFILNMSGCPSYYDLNENPIWC